MTTVWSRVRVVGPLASHADRFAEWLVARGYTDLSTAELVRLVGHFSRWLVSVGVDPSELDAGAVEEYCRARRAEGRTARLTPASLGCVLEFLRSEGLAPPAPVRGPALAVPADELLLHRYRRYLTAERGLVERVVEAWVRVAVSFMTEFPGLGSGATAIGAAEVTAFCVAELPRRKGSSARNLAAALRSFLRFVHVEGVVAAPLAQAVPSVAIRKGAALPCGVSAEAVAGLLASCDRCTPVGRRDFAILVVLARLGLRAGEVAGLGLDDFDWRAGELVVHGKGRRQDRMPLPSDVGEAVVDYLRHGRPPAEDRVVFVRAIAPVGPLTAARISGVVYDACARAGVPQIGAHRLRHALAVDILRAGGDLVEIGQLLRHARVATTAIYAKVDHAALAPLAPAWPGGAS